MPISTSKIRLLWLWLAKPRYTWLAIGIVVIALVISLRPHTSELTIRTTGLVLQTLGILTVAWGIYKTRKFFGHPPFTVKVKSWLEQFPLIHRKTVIKVNAASFGSSTSKASVYSTHQPTEKNPTTEERLKSLERNITLIHERITSTEKEMDKEFQKITEVLKIEEQTRQTEDNDIRAKLETTGTGGIHISATGALWLFFGVILSTMSVEIAELLK
ncbi:hypothetical protein Nstercoris_01137 [Nitrosomonas stercoris]|uniref:Uncharacterized protein n=1 Tax=Nitrosomonas stercoris TaxID=1444684 RepID=A0A4Y1YLA6_9PROT|nr:hypothetical protein Nstercoris_01137 [Nitrosomonas stercoris]